MWELSDTAVLTASFTALYLTVALLHNVVPAPVIKGYVCAANASASFELHS